MGFPGDLEGNKVKVKSPTLPVGLVSTSYGEVCMLWPAWPLTLAQGERPDVELFHSFLPGTGQTFCVRRSRAGMKRSCSFS